MSHDRAFLDNVVTSTLVFEGDGRWREYEGGVQDWLDQSQRARSLAPAATPAPAPARPTLRESASAAARRKLSYKDQRELEALPALIDSLEAEQRAIHEELADGSLYGRDPLRAAQLAERSGHIENELMQALERWEQLGSV